MISKTIVLVQLISGKTDKISWDSHINYNHKYHPYIKTQHQEKNKYKNKTSCMLNK